jgi:hypothetical protein
VVISEGTRERLNLHRVSVTFSRAWKEADLIIAKGEFNHRRLLLTSHQFTRDILSFRRDREGVFHLEVKPRAPGIRKFAEADIQAKAEEIIQSMRAARLSGEKRHVLQRHHRQHPGPDQDGPSPSSTPSSPICAPG